MYENCACSSKPFSPRKSQQWRFKFLYSMFVVLHQLGHQSLGFRDAVIFFSLSKQMQLQCLELLWILLSKFLSIHKSVPLLPSIFAAGTYKQFRFVKWTTKICSIKYGTLGLAGEKNRIFSTHAGCPGGNVPDFGIMFLKLKYTDITQNTYVYSK